MTCGRSRVWSGGMTVADRERILLEELALMPDPHERLAHLIRRAERRPVLAASERVDAALVPGCVSRVWLAGSLENGRCHFRVAADSPMVLGLMGLLCDVYEGGTPEEVAAFDSDVFARSGLDRALSPTRLQGLAHARARINFIAAALAATGQTTA
jgi:cysteine desulfuration protein SufE